MVMGWDGVDMRLDEEDYCSALAWNCTDTAKYVTKAMLSNVEQCTKVALAVFCHCKFRVNLCMCTRGFTSQYRLDGILLCHAVILLCYAHAGSGVVLVAMLDWLELRGSIVGKGSCTCLPPYLA